MPDRISTDYTLELAEEHIANANGNVDRLNELHAFGDSQTPNTPGSGNGSQLFSLAGVTQHMTDTGLSGGLPLGQTNVSNNTVTQTTAQALSQQFTIPANDANVGTAYRINSWGNGQWGATAQAFAFGVGFPGTTEMFTHLSIAAGAFGTNATFRWNAESLLVCQSTGNTGTWSATGRFFITQTANSSDGLANTTNTLNIADGTTTDVTQDTTIANTYCIICWWGSTTGSPTITSRSSVFERIGP